jgi:hypothetical protein
VAAPPPRHIFGFYMEHFFSWSSQRPNQIERVFTECDRMTAEIKQGK